MKSTRGFSSTMYLTFQWHSIWYQYGFNVFTIFNNWSDNSSDFIQFWRNSGGEGIFKPWTDLKAHSSSETRPTSGLWGTWWDTGAVFRPIILPHLLVMLIYLFKSFLIVFSFPFFIVWTCSLVETLSCCKSSMPPLTFKQRTNDDRCRLHKNAIGQPHMTSLQRINDW